jgi:hypothetical protein
MCKKCNIEQLQEFAKSKGGEFLDSDYVNAHAKYKWKCKEGHIWLANWNNIKTGKWCPTCGGRPEQHIEDLQKFAEGKGGNCLSIKYVNHKTKYTWRCNKGHIWEAVWNNIHNSNQWCPYCSGRLGNNILTLQRYAETKNGKCLSLNYTYGKNKYLWECSKGHQWKATWNNINTGYWCPKCAGKERHTIEILQEFAKSKEGNLLSTEYINAKTKYQWRCKKGHIWKSQWGHMKNQNHWCPDCLFKNEAEVRKIFEDLFGVKFNKTKPTFLKLKKYSSLELDGYNERLKLAFEYDGEFHYKPHPKDRDNYSRRIELDKLKDELCAKNNVTLIRIPYTVKNKKKFIINKLIELGLYEE